MAQALVTDGHTRAAVAGLRGLGRAGIQAVVLAPGHTAGGLWSRYATARAVGPDPGKDMAGFVSAVQRLATERGPLVVYPAREEAVEALARGGATMTSKAVLPFPLGEPLAALRDKQGLATLARGCGFGTPRLLAQGAARELYSSSLPLPAVVKPASPVGQLKTAHVVESQEQLVALLERGRVPGNERLLVQERIDGPLISIEMVLSRQRGTVAFFQQKGRQTWPARAGSICDAVSVAPDRGLAERAAAMLAEVGYWGLAQIDVLESDRGPVLIDVNPRFYGCLPLALACGVNLARAWHAVALGEPCERSRPYRLGVTYRWLEADVAAAFRGAPRRLLRLPVRPGAAAMWAPDDPLAGALLAVESVTKRIRARRPPVCFHR